jgi:hypothetical protein
LGVILGACSQKDSPAESPQGLVVTVVSGTPSCPECRIEMVKLATIRDEEGERAFSNRSFFYYGWSSGGWYLHTDKGVYYHYDSTGKYVGRLGREGRGPGEMLNPYAIHAARGDSIYVVEPGTVHVFTAAGQYGRRFSGAINVNSNAALPDGRIVSGSEEPQPVGLFSLIDAEGKTVRTFTGNPRPNQEQREQSVGVASAANGRIWSADMASYVLSRWDTTGKEELRLRASFPWFPVSELPINSRPLMSPSLSGIQEDSAGLLWVLSIVTDKDFETKFPGDSWKKARFKAEAQRDLYDYIVDVIDPSTGKLVATRRVDEYLTIGLIGPQHVVSFDDDESGIRRANIWKLRLTGYSPRR